MKKLFLIVLIVVHSCIAFAQDYCVNDTIVREIQFPLSLQDTKSEFFYFNNEWIPLAYENEVHPDSIQSVEIKNDEYGNRSAFFTVSPEYLAHIKAEQRKYLSISTLAASFPEATENSKNGLMKISVFPKDSRVAKEYWFNLPFILTAQSVTRRLLGARAEMRLSIRRL